MDLWIYGSTEKKPFDLQWKSGGVPDEKIQVFNENLGSPMKIWDLQWKSGVSNENLGSPMKIWGLQCKSGISNENLGFSDKKTPMRMFGFWWKRVSHSNQMMIVSIPRLRPRVYHLIPRVFRFRLILIILR